MQVGEDVRCILSDIVGIPGGGSLGGRLFLRGLGNGVGRAKYVGEV